MCRFCASWTILVKSLPLDMELWTHVCRAYKCYCFVLLDGSIYIFWVARIPHSLQFSCWKIFNYFLIRKKAFPFNPTINRPLEWKWMRREVFNPIWQGVRNLQLCSSRKWPLLETSNWVQLADSEILLAAVVRAQTCLKVQNMYMVQFSNSICIILNHPCYVCCKY